MPELVRSANANAVTRSSETPTGTGGRIIFVSATIHYTGLPLQTHVAAAKAAVDQLSSSVAIEYGPRGVTSNIIAPGPIGGTEGMDRLVKPEDIKAAEKHVPAGRYGTVKDIADATIYLFADTGNYVNGEILVVDGGAWHVPKTGPGGSFQYPDFILRDKAVEGVKGGKKSKL
jgi:peroxisomal 2,4-dienoyl-CoA reductase